MMDALRLMPLLGLVLWMVPLLWAVPEANGQGTAMPMSDALRFVFGVWAAMVLAGWALWCRAPDPQGDADSAP